MMSRKDRFCWKAHADMLIEDSVGSVARSNLNDRQSAKIGGNSAWRE